MNAALRYGKALGNYLSETHLQSESGERLSSISYHTLKGVSLGSHSNRKRSASERSGNEELWDNLERHILSEQAHPSKRFAPKEVRKMMQDASWDFLVRNIAWYQLLTYDRQNAPIYF